MDLTSQTTAELIKALAKAQSAMPNIVKSGTNPRFKNKYAKYDDIRKACVNVLSDHGLVITQHVWPEGETQYLVTRLSHTSGEWMQSRCVLPINEFTAQSFGSAVTYCKRYSLEAILMLGGDDSEDDDGEEASKPPVARKTTEKPKIAELTQKEPMSSYEKLKRKIAATGADMRYFQEYMKERSTIKNKTVEFLSENALLNEDVTILCTRMYMEWVAEKSKVA